jgi:DNA-directed RNA polymerase alpha subunit
MDDYFKKLELEIKRKDEEIRKLKFEILCKDEEIKRLRKENEELQKSDEDKMLNKPIIELGLSNRAYLCLVKSGIRTVNDIIQKKHLILNCKNGRWPKIRNLGSKTLPEILNKMEEIGIPLE